MVRDDVIRWRRYLHQHPELSFCEEKTAQFVCETLESFGGLQVSRPTRTSVMARLIGRAPGRVLAMRADLDALPIQEENTFEFASVNAGVMHACGHDGHTAMLLGAAKILTQLQEQLHGEIRFLFQHAEELYPGGAEELVQAGVMDGVDAVIGAHLWSPIEVGKIGVAEGPVMAAPDKFWITIKGRGGHLSVAHRTVDAVAIGSQVVTNLQQIVARNTDPLEPLLLYVTKFVGGIDNNIIPNEVELSGTVRSYSQALRETVPVQIEQIVKGITEAHGATYELRYEFGYRPVINDAQITAVVAEAVRERFGAEALFPVLPQMAGEDFSAYLQKAPGTFFFVGAGNPECGICYPHHHPRFTIDEAALEIGVQLFVHTACKF